MKASEILRGAMGHVNKGWCKGALEDGAGHMCALGAVNMAAAGKAYVISVTDEHSAADFALRNVCMEWGYGRSIADMNNHASTTKQDVLVAMEKAAISLEERGQ